MFHAGGEVTWESGPSTRSLSLYKEGTIRVHIGGQQEVQYCLVILSRRNLETLVTKLGQPGSARTLYKQLQVEDENRVTVLVVTAEENEPHYRGVEPGVVHPTTEELLEREEPS